MTVYIVRQGTMIAGVWLDHAQAMRQASTINAGTTKQPNILGQWKRPPLARIEQHPVRGEETSS